MGQTMSGASGGSVAGLDVIANSFTMGPKEINLITDDPTSGSPEALVTALALQTAVAGLIATIQQNVQNVLTGLDGLVVLTQNLVSPTFALVSQEPNLGWLSTGWVCENNTATISNVDNVFDTLNSLSIPPGRYPNIGVYFLTFTVTSISGTLSVILNGQAIGTVTSLETHNFIIPISNAINTTLNLVASNVQDNQSIVLTDAVLTGINPVLYNLIEFIAAQLTGQDQSGAIAAALATAEAFATTAVDDSMAAHLAAANPHPQYELLINAAASAGSPLASDSIIYSPDAFTPFQIPGKNQIRNSTIVKTSTLDHISASAYCSNSGYLTSTVISSGLVNAVINSATSPSQPTALFALNSSNLPVLTYKFSKPRIISEVILFTQLASQTSSVTQASVTVGSTTETINISTGALNAIVSGNASFSNIEATEIIITVLSVNDGSQPSLSLGFDVYFSDTGGKDIAISGDTAFTVNYNNQVKLLTPGTDVPVDVSSTVQGHEYYLSLKTTDGSTLVPEIIPIPPIWGDGSITYQYPFENFISNTDPYYGTISVTGLTSPSTYYQVYTTAGAVVTNSNYVAITQTMTTATIIDHLNIKFPSSLIAGAGYPTSITVNITESGGTTTSLSITPNYMLDGLSDLYTITVDLSSYGALSAFQIILISTNGTTCALSKIEVAVPCLSYDTSKHVWSDGICRKIVGSFLQFSNGAYQVSSQPVGNNIIIPINDLAAVSFYTQYTVQNPFKTKNVEVSALNPDRSDTNNILIQKITDSSFTILATSTGTYLLSVSKSS